MKIISIRLTDEEHAAMKAVCAREFLTTSAYIRRHFNMRAAELGLKIPDHEALRAATPKGGAELAAALDNLLGDDPVFDEEN